MGDFTASELTARKQRQGLRASVVIPARNEAATIAGVLASASAFRGTLVDEIVVIDGGSTDETVAVATRAGARVVRQPLVDTLGVLQGKGDALWRSLAVTDGDILIFLDADIRDPHPCFVAGLLGPLLCDDEVDYVKAFYERPLEVAGVLHPLGGGRVTELTARPLLNTFWPELAGLVQPLAGEYAGRRHLLESLPFVTGYGVEFGLLVDILASRGAGAIAQVDMEQRIHRNQSLPALSRMAFAITEVARRRLAADGRLRGDAMERPYLQFERVGARLLPRPVDVPVFERPPWHPACPGTHG